MKRILATLTLAACASPAPPATPAPAAAPPMVSMRALPDSVRSAAGTFRLIGARAVQGTPTDTLYRYADSTGFGVSVIRFPIRDDVKAGADSAKWLEREAAKFVAIQPILKGRGVIDSFHVRMQRPVPIYPNGPPVEEYITVVEQYSSRGRTREIEYLYIIGGKFFKIRGSEPHREEGMSPTAQFARRIVLMVTR